MDVNKIIDDLKARGERLKIKFDLSKIDAENEFEYQKEKMNSWIDENDFSIESIKGTSETQIELIKTKIDELKVQLALGRAESEEALREQAKNLTIKLHEIRVELEKNKKLNNFKDETKDIMDEFNESFIALKANFMKGVDDVDWDRYKYEAQDKFDKFSKEAEELKGESTEKIEAFKVEVQKAWSNFRKSFNKEKDT
ncbi:MAG: hypothetical protein KAG96_06900 [Ichthyobacteriaceae bacterium]|nr:hypothetical protein [Ichthyobacteriaceae bacterium]